MDDSKDSGGRPRRRRARKWIAVALVPIAVLAILFLARNALGRKLLVGGLERDYRVDVELERLALAPTLNALALRGLAVIGPDAREVLRLDSLDARFDPLAALGGGVDLDLELVGLAVTVWREPNGTWNLAGLPRTSGSGGSAGGGEERESEPSEREPIDLTAHCLVRDARVVVLGAEGATELVVDEARVDADGAGRPIAVHATGSLHGVGGSGGALALESSVRLGGPSGFEPEGELNLSLEDLVLASLRPILDELLPPGELGGTANVEVEATLGADGLPRGDLHLSATDLSLPTADGERLAFASVTAGGTASALASGAAETRLECRADDWLELDWSGTVRARSEADAPARVSGESRLRVDLARLADFARVWTLEPARRELAGELTAVAGIELDPETTDAKVSLELVPRDLRANDESGEPLDLAAWNGARLTASLQRAEGALAVPSFRLQGPLELNGSFAGRLDPEALSLAPLELATPWMDASFTGEVLLPAEGSSSLATLRGLHGEIDYEPEGLGAALGELVPGTWSGTERRSIRLELDGEVPTAEPPGVLADLVGSVRVGVGGWTVEGIALDGELTAELAPNLVELAGRFDANGGVLALDGRVVPDSPEATSESPAMNLQLDAERVRVDRDVGRLFSYLHPAFAVVDDLEGAAVDGVADASIELAWGAPIPWQALLESDEELDLTPLRGRGTVAVNQVVIEGSALLQRLRKELDDDPDAELRLREMSFVLSEGRLRYDRPWTWTIGDSETSFTGSVGLDRTLDLSWSVPVTPALADRYRFLRKLEGRRLDVPLRGTTDDPKLELSGVAENLAGSLLEDVLPGLTGGGGDADSPGELLRRADELWSAGDKTAAAALYARIREDHQLTLVYTLNRKRIKERSKYRE